MKHTGLSDRAKGRVFFEAEGGFADRFLDLCKKNGADLKNIRITSDSVSASVLTSALCRIDSAAKKSGMTLTVTNRKGLRYTLEKIKKRFGIPFGFFSAIVIFCILSCMIWSVEIRGCSQTDDAVIAGILREYGIERGKFLFNADISTAKRRIESSDRSIYKSVIDVEGSRVYVNIVENTIPEKIRPEDEYSNIVASCDGTIIGMDLFAGEAEVKCGDTVKKGDLLVSGITELDDGRNVFTRAAASVKALTEHTVRVVSVPSPEISVIRKYSDVYSPYVFGLSFTGMLKKLPENRSETEYFAESAHTVFPFGIVRLRKTFFEKCEDKLTQDRVRLIAVRDLANEAIRKCGELTCMGRIIRRDDTNSAFIEAVFYCEEDIATEKIIIIDTDIDMN